MVQVICMFLGQGDIYSPLFPYIARKGYMCYIGYIYIHTYYTRYIHTIQYILHIPLTYSTQEVNLYYTYYIYIVNSIFFYLLQSLFFFLYIQHTLRSKKFIKIQQKNLER